MSTCRVPSSYRAFKASSQSVPTSLWTRFSFLFLFTSWGHWLSERSSHLIKVTQQSGWEQGTERQGPPSGQLHQAAGYMMAGDVWVSGSGCANGCVLGWCYYYYFISLTHRRICLWRQWTTAEKRCCGVVLQAGFCPVSSYLIMTWRVCEQRPQGWRGHTPAAYSGSICFWTVSGWPCFEAAWPAAACPYFVVLDWSV